MGLVYIYVAVKLWIVTWIFYYKVHLYVCIWIYVIVLFCHLLLMNL
jgi:hypothetical protein